MNTKNLFNEKNELVKKEIKDIDLKDTFTKEELDALPDWLKDNSLLKEHKEVINQNFDSEDILIPRLKIIQATSKDKFGASDGDIVNISTGENFGKSIEIIPLVMWKSRILFDDNSFKLVCSSPDAILSTDGKKCSECEFSKWNDKDAPRCKLVYNYAVVIRKELKTNPIPIIISFMGAQVKTAKKINSVLFFLAKDEKPIFSKSIKLFTKEETFDRGRAYIFDYSIGSWITNEEFKKILELAVDFKDMQNKANKDVETVVEDEKIPF